VTRFGLFVKLDETGADGFVPVSTLGGDFFHHDEIIHALIGERTRVAYRLGDAVRVRLEEAVPVTGGLRFELLEGGGEAPKGAGRRTRSPAGRSGPKRGKSGPKAPRGGSRRR